MHQMKKKSSCFKLSYRKSISCLFLFFILACGQNSNHQGSTKGEDNNNTSALAKKQAEIAGEMVNQIKAPIDQARGVASQADEITKKQEMDLQNIQHEQK